MTDKERKEYIDTMNDILIRIGLEDIQKGGERLDIMGANECFFNAADRNYDLLKLRFAFNKCWPYWRTEHLDMVRRNGRLHIGIIYLSESL